MRVVLKGHLGSVPDPTRHVPDGSLVGRFLLEIPPLCGYDDLEARQTGDWELGPGSTRPYIKADKESLRWGVWIH